MKTSILQRVYFLVMTTKYSFNNSSPKFCFYSHFNASTIESKWNPRILFRHILLIMNMYLECRTFVRSVQKKNKYHFGVSRIISHRSGNKKVYKTHTERNVKQEKWRERSERKRNEHIVRTKQMFGWNLPTVNGIVSSALVTSCNRKRIFC